MGAECFAAGIGHGVGGVGLSTDELLDGLDVTQFLKSLDVTCQITVRNTEHGLEGVEIGLASSGQHRHYPQPYAALERLVKILDCGHRFYFLPSNLIWNQMPHTIWIIPNPMAHSIIPHGAKASAAIPRAISA